MTQTDYLLMTTRLITSLQEVNKTALSDNNKVLRQEKHYKSRNC